MASTTGQALAQATITVATTVFTSAKPTASATGVRAAPQGGIFDKLIPTHYDKKNPITNFIIQAGIIIIFCRLLQWPLSKLRQPRVISEVIGGILLGPSAFGKIPGFTAAIFPTESMSALNVVANLGLILFLFVIGLEVDLRLLVKNWKVATTVSVASMLLPFGAGAGIAWGLYNEFKHEPNTVPISFGIFMLFIGIAMAITAFPVLCRILTELNLLTTTVGTIVLSAGVGNDVVGWVLLALCVTLVNAGNGLTALWVLLTCVGYILFLVYAVRPVFLRLLRKTGSIENGPSQGVIAITLLLCLASAFFTQIIGVHAIFGGFMIGLICPHEGGFAIKVTEKIEDIIGALFLPLYFTLSGLNTDISLLDTGMTWAYVIGVILVAFSSKFIGATIAARFTGLVWRESFAIGSLMSCKGLVELIVLNIGLQAKILSTRTFTIFVVMALVTTFATTPLTITFYPAWYQKKMEAWRRGEIDWDTDAQTPRSDSVSQDKLENSKIQNILVYLRLDNMPSILAFMSVLAGRSAQATTVKKHPSLPATSEEETEAPKKALQAHGLRLLGINDRDSTVMKIADEEYSQRDPIVNTFRTLSQFHNIAISGEVSLVPDDTFAQTLTGKAAEETTDLILLPWTENGGISDLNTASLDGAKTKLSSTSYNHFVSSALDQAPCNVAVFVSSNFGGSSKVDRPRLKRVISGISIRSAREGRTAPISDRSHHIFFPFFGGADDRAALRLVLQLAENPEVTATIVHYEATSEYYSPAESAATPSSPVVSSPISHHSTKQAFITAHSIPTERDNVFFSSLKNSLPADVAPRVLFEIVQTATPLADALARIKTEVGQTPRNAGDLVVLGRNYGARSAYAKEITTAPGTEEAGRTLGVFAPTILQAGLSASVLVMQAKNRQS